MMIVCAFALGLCRCADGSSTTVAPVCTADICTVAFRTDYSVTQAGFVLNWTLAGLPS